MPRKSQYIYNIKKIFVDYDIFCIDFLSKMPTVI